jgi:hypothetical protein
MVVPSWRVPEDEEEGQHGEQAAGNAKQTGLYSAAARKRREQRAHARAGQWMEGADHSAHGNWLSRREKTFWDSEGGLVMKVFGIGTFANRVMSGKMESRTCPF